MKELSSKLWGEDKEVNKRTYWKKKVLFMILVQIDLTTRSPSLMKRLFFFLPDTKKKKAPLVEKVYVLLLGRQKESESSTLRNPDDRLPSANRCVLF